MVDVGAAAIANGRVTFTSGTWLRQSTINASGRQECIVSVIYDVNSDLGAGVGLKYTPSPRNCYYVVAGGTLAAPVWYLNKLTSGAPSLLKSVSGQSLSTGAHTLRLLYNNGLLTLWVDSVLILTYADSTYGANTGAAFYSPAAVELLDAYTLLGDEAVTFSVVPSPIGNFGTPVALSFTGLATAWTPGTPGSPTFTVDHGVLSDQEVLTATTATATYTPGSFLGLATFTDPSTGATCQAQVTSDTSIVPPPTGAGGIPLAVIDWLVAQATHGGLVLSDTDTTSGDVSGIELKGAFGSMLLGTRTGSAPTTPNVPTALAVMTIWDVLNGQLAHESEADVFTTAINLLSELRALQADLTDLRSVSQWDLQEVLDLLRGTGAYNHTELMTAIQAVGAPDNQEVRDAIAAAQGDPLATVKAVLDLVFTIKTESGLDLGDVVGAVEAARGAGLPTVKGVLDKLGPGGTSLEAQLNALSDLIVTESTLTGLLSLALAAFGGEAGLTLAAARDAILDAVQAAPAAAARVPPIWPGLEQATIGPSSALSDGLELAGPLDGVLIHITGTPARAGRFAFGDVSSWKYVGAVVFKSDRGDWEWNHPIGLDSQVITPKAMTHAAAARFRLEGGWTGTVRPFTVGA